MTKKKLNKNAPRPINAYGFKLTIPDKHNQSEIWNGEQLVGRYYEGEFFPSLLGGQLGFVWMMVHNPKEVLFHLKRQQENIKNPPKRNFKRKVEAGE